MFYFVLSLFLITFVGTLSNQITDTTYNALTASVLMIKAQYTSYIYRTTGQHQLTKSKRRNESKTFYYNIKTIRYDGAGTCSIV